MTARVTYWTGIWDPAREALSKEVATLRAALSASSPIVSFSAGQRTRVIPRQGVVQLSARRWLVLRALARVLEPLGRITHVVGELGPWHLLRAVGRRPTLLTVAIAGPSIHRALYTKVSLFAAESDALARSLVDAGVPRERIHIIYPGIDLSVFDSHPMTSLDPFHILFASTPADPREFEARGIPLLIEATRRCPDVRLTLLWRRWGRLADARAALAALAPPSNVVVEYRDASDMRAEYHRVAATACLYAEDFGKPCPHSVIESLACGRPVLVSRTLGVASLVEQAGAGIAVPRTVEGVVAGIQRLRQLAARGSEAPRRVAVERFSLEQFVSRYAALYDQLSPAAPM